MCYVIDNWAQYWDERVRCAQKPHECIECADGVLPGELYLRIKMLFDGYWSTWAMCARCFWDHERVYRYERSRGCAPHESSPLHGELHEAMQTYVDEVRWERSQQGEHDEAPTGWEPSPITYREAA